MTQIFILSSLFIIFTLPFIIVIFLLYYLSNKFIISFKITGWYQISEFKFIFENETIKINLSVEKFKIILIPFRIRFQISGIKSLIELNHPIKDKNDEILLKNKYSFEFIDKENESLEEKINKENFNKIKNNFYQILKEKFGDFKMRKKHFSNSNEKKLETVDNLIFQKKMNKLEILIRNLIVFFDMEILDLNTMLKFKEEKVFHEVFMESLIVGMVKGSDNKNELDIIAVLYNLKINQYRVTNNKNNSNNLYESNFYKELKDDECILNNLIKIENIFIKGKFENGIFNTENRKSFLSILNTLSICTEISNVKINLSTFSLKKIFKIIENLIKINQNSENTNLNNYNSLTLPTIPIEQQILSNIQSKLKKLKIKIENLNLNILSDNHIFPKLKINSKYFNFIIKNNFNQYYDNKLMTSQIEIKLQELEILSSINRKEFTQITKISQFMIIIKDEIIYDFVIQKCEINSNLDSDLNNVDMTLNTKDLEKILEIVMCIVNGLEKIEKLEKMNKNNSIESCVNKQNIKFNYNNINVNLFNEKLMAELYNINFELEINKVKKVRNNIQINFSPILISFTNLNKCIIDDLYNYSCYFSSCVFINNFNLEIDENFLNYNSEIKIIFKDLDIIIYDDHLIEIIEFVSQFLTAILQESINKKFKKIKKVKIFDEKIKLIFNDVRLVKYLDYDDIISGKFEEMILIVDDYMEIPKIKFYHQTNFARHHKHILQNKTKIIDLFDFKIDFKNDLNNNNCNKDLKFEKIDIKFAEININFYCLELACAISKISTFYIFFPEWIDYYFIRRFLPTNIDNKNFIKKDKVNILFEQIKVEINDYKISSVGILHLDKKNLESFQNLTDKEKIRILNKNKRNLLTLILNNFEIIVDDLKEFTNKNNSLILHRKGSVLLKFPEIEVLHETNILILLKSFNILLKDEIKDSNFKLEEKITYIITHKNHILIYNNISHKRHKITFTNFNIENLLINFDDVKIFDQTINLLFKAMNTFNEFNFNNYIVSVNSDLICKNESQLSLTLSNLEGGINSIDPITEQIYNKLVLKINFLCLKNDNNILEISLHFFSFGFDPSQKSGFPLVIIPMLEFNLDNKMNKMRINIPSIENLKFDKNVKNDKLGDNYNISNHEFLSLYSETYQSELHNLLMKTKSITLFLNFKYLSTFVKIFGIFWEKTKFLRDGFSNINLQRNYNKESEEFSSDTESFTTNSSFKNIKNYNNKKDNKIILSVFDLKIVYLLEYKEEYSTIFKFNSDIKTKGYFGYIFRLYQFNLKYYFKSLKNSDSLKLNSNLFTVSFLTEENFNDDIFFKYDREISLLKFQNLKENKAFNSFFEIESGNKYNLINTNNLEYFENLMKNNKNHSIQNLEDLMFDYKHTLIKISELSFKRKYQKNENVESITILLDNLKVTWNKFNKDVLQLLLFDDVLLIVDRIILKLKKEENKNNLTKLQTKISILDFGKFNFEFRLNNPQIVIQNELKKSTLLLTNKEPCKVIISKLCLNEASKEFKLEVIYDKLCLYSAPNYMDSNFIYWIGDIKENKYYLEENLFKNILESPKIRFKINQIVKTNQFEEFDYYSEMNINVDRINCEMESVYFNDFMNVVEVFIFDRGYSFAEVKNDIDSKKIDLERFKLKDLETMIKSNFTIKTKKNILKKITFSLDRVQLNMSKGGKPMIQLQLLQFEGEHLIYPDKGSDTRLNVRDLQIKNIESNRNDILLAPLAYDNTEEFEDKMNLLIFRKKDSYVNIGTDSQWYTLDYLELSIRPLRVNISKAQIEFIVDFFFLEDSEEVDEEEQRNLLMSTSKYREKSIVKKEEVVEKKKEKKNGENYPIYFKQVKVNDTVLLLNFQYAENSSWNLNNAKIKFGHFDKFEKFYSSKILLDRFVSHCKRQCFKNISSIISSLFGQGSQIGKPSKDDEEKHRKLLFGNK